MPYWGLSSFYFSYFALLGIIMPYWNLYLDNEGYSANQIGMLGAVLMGTKIVSPYLLGIITDHTQKPVKLIRWVNFITILCFSLIFFQTEFSSETSARFYYLLFVVAAFTFFWNAVIGQFEAVTMLWLKERYYIYGQIRLWGSIGFIAAVTGVGWLVDTMSIDVLPVVILYLLILIWLSSFLVPEVDYSQPSRETSNTNSNVTMKRLLFSKAAIAFFLGCLLMKVAHGPYYIFYSIYLEHYDYSKLEIGLLWAVGVMVELILFLFISRSFNRFSTTFILSLSAAVGIARWLLIGYFPENMFILIIAQTFHAFTFASYHAASVEWVRRYFGLNFQGKGQALYSAISFGLGGSIGAILSGWLWTDNQSVFWLYSWIMASVLSLLAMVSLLNSTQKDTGNIAESNR